MSATPEQIAQHEAEEREAEAFVAAQWAAADAWIAAEWPHASDETRAAVRSAWTQQAIRHGEPTQCEKDLAQLVKRLCRRLNVYRAMLAASPAPLTDADGVETNDGGRDA